METSIAACMNEFDCPNVKNKAWMDMKEQKQGIAKSYCLWKDLHDSIVSEQPMIDGRSWEMVAVNFEWAATKADGLSLFQVGEKGRGLKAVSLGAEMNVLYVSKRRETGSISKRCFGKSDTRYT